jgi:hypothetical protein
MTVFITAAPNVRDRIVIDELTDVFNEFSQSRPSAPSTSGYSKHPHKVRSWLSALHLPCKPLAISPIMPSVSVRHFEFAQIARIPSADLLLRRESSSYHLT